MRATPHSPFVLAAVALGALALGCGQTETGETPDDEALAFEAIPDAVTADPAHYAVEFENEAVRLLRVHYDVGERSVMHRHPTHCAVVLGEASWRMTDPAGEVTEGSGTLGDVMCAEEPIAHLPVNTGDGPAELVLVEFKPGATAGSDELPDAPDAVTADPEHYTVEFEDEAVRLVRIAYGPGETSVMHRHPASCAIFLSDQPTRFELPDGEVEEHEPQEAGGMECGDAGAHLPTNLGGDELELILVEFKGRATLEG